MIISTILVKTTRGSTVISIPRSRSDPTQLKPNPSNQTMTVTSLPTASNDLIPRAKSKIQAVRKSPSHLKTPGPLAPTSTLTPICPGRPNSVGIMRTGPCRPTDPMSTKDSMVTLPPLLGRLLGRLHRDLPLPAIHRRLDIPMDHLAVQCSSTSPQESPP